MKNLAKEIISKVVDASAVFGLPTIAATLTIYGLYSGSLDISNYKPRFPR